MKRIFQLLLLTSLIAFSACTKKTTIVKTSLPPGQVKKITGSKSAAPYAPGQAKKASGPSGTTASSASKAKGKSQDKKK
jgi:hypothetical protein